MWDWWGSGGVGVGEWMGGQGFRLGMKFLL